MKDKTLQLEEIYSKNELIWGKEAQQALFKKHIVVAGLGGVGAYVADALARSGIGRLTLIDFDKVSESNINRQLLGLLNNVGKYKTDLMKERIENINPHIQVDIINDFYTSVINSKIFNGNPDFLADAIDTLKYKIDLIESAVKLNIPVISSMGAGNRLDPSKLYISDISKIKPTKCPFVKNILNKLKKSGIESGITVVTSSEKPFITEKCKVREEITLQNYDKIELTKFVPASTPFVPPVAGYLMAAYIVKKLISDQ